MDLKVSFAEGEIVSKWLKICLVMHSFGQFSAIGGKIVVVFLVFKFVLEVDGCALVQRELARCKIFREHYVFGLWNFQKMMCWMVRFKQYREYIVQSILENFFLYFLYFLITGKSLISSIVYVAPPIIDTDPIWNLILCS